MEYLHSRCILQCSAVVPFAGCHTKCEIPRRMSKTVCRHGKGTSSHVSSRHTTDRAEARSEEEARPWGDQLKYRLTGTSRTIVMFVWDMFRP